MEALPAWDIESEYPGIASPAFQSDERRWVEITRKLQELSPQLSQTPVENPRTLGIMKEYFQLLNEGLLLQKNLSTFVNAKSSVNAKDAEALAKTSEMEVTQSRFEQSLLPFRLFLDHVSEAFLQQLFEDPVANSFRFQVEEGRKLAPTRLPAAEENLILSLQPSGVSAWSHLYFQITGTLQLEVKLQDQTKTMGVAEAQGLLGSPQEEVRRAGWQAVQEGWRAHEEAAAAGLNAMAGWRLELMRRRSHRQKMDFLTTPLWQSKISRETLDAMMGAVWNNVERSRGLYRQMAKAIGKAKLDPWDLLAPAPLPTQEPLEFKTALRLVEDAFQSVDPQMGEFIRTMRKNNWIEARVMPGKAGGAFCTSFPKSRTPRVFQSFLGNAKDLTTLAHELGHGFHHWAMRDLPLPEHFYPMTLAETASIFSEKLLTQHLQNSSQNAGLVTEARFAEMEHAAGLLVNIPARFDFEAGLYERRAARAQTPDELRALNREVWAKWYGDTLTQNDEMYWATKLHFHIGNLTFYNFPYTFGYLFGLSIYARREELGSRFFPKYVEILRDTGRMSAEDLVTKHLGEDIQDSKFWQKAIDVALAGHGD